MEALAAALAELLRADPGEPLAPNASSSRIGPSGGGCRSSWPGGSGLPPTCASNCPRASHGPSCEAPFRTSLGSTGSRRTSSAGRIHDVLPAFAAEDREGRAVRRYLADGDPRKRFELADRLAGVFDRCLVYRPDWIRAWDGGDAPSWQAGSGGGGAGGDGGGGLGYPLGSRSSMRFAPPSGGGRVRRSGPAGRASLRFPPSRPPFSTC